MLSPIAAGCFAAVLLSTSSLASSIAIAFGNPTFAGITFGHPYNIEWFGGNGMVQYGAPVPIGFGRYYPLENRAAQNDDFNTGAVFPRTEGIFRHGYPTGTPVGTEVSPAYPTGTPAGSNAPPAHATGTSTGSVSGLMGAARATYSPPITGGAQTTSLGWSNLATLALVFVGCVSALLRI
ncbi:MAG: hypothetical protein LQ344_007559 [Seirophora lacunosa]|nr:MAG: hypothetical protein LQ344_007559 [Seirophora lacunosa]